jgi:hypothetical protein
VVFVLGLLATYWPIALIIVGAYGLYILIRLLLKNRYFNSDEFKNQIAEISAVVAEHNEITGYVDEIRNSGKFDLGHSETGAQAHLATTTNTSNFGYKRDRNVATLGASNVHNTSLQVVRNAAAEPIKYLVKYFDVDTSEEGLAEIENLGESISRLENAVTNLKTREQSITTEISPPKFILKHYLKEFQEKVGLEISEVSIPYPSYKFEYVSAGGNSSQVTEVKLNTPTLDSLIEYLAEKIKFKKSAAGQRALMTASFREKIKSRDSYTCQICSISTQDEEHLLLEVDHIKPVSKGGLSVEENLQTLCWKCNRTKSNIE